MRKNQQLLFVILLLVIAIAVPAYTQSDPYGDAAEVLTNFNYDACVQDATDSGVCLQLQQASVAFWDTGYCEDTELPELPEVVYVPTPDGLNSNPVRPDWTERGCYSAATLISGEFFTVAYLLNGDWFLPDGGGTFATTLGNAQIEGLFETTLSNVRITALVVGSGPNNTPYSVLMWNNPLVDNFVHYSQGSIEGIGALDSAQNGEGTIIVTGSDESAVLNYNVENNIAYWE